METPRTWQPEDGGAPPPGFVAELIRLENAQRKRRRDGAQHAGAGWEIDLTRSQQEEAFQRALGGLHMVFQPVISWPDRGTFAYEALLRTGVPAIPHPPLLLALAERLDRIGELGRTVRKQVACSIAAAPEGMTFLVNLDALELLDRTLYLGSSPLARHASRVILEITERSALDEVGDAPRRIARLRELGFRIAIDDLGSGYADLASVALLEPDVVKLDRSLVHRLQHSPTRQKLVGWIASLCGSLGIQVIAEGIETAAERDAAVKLGCELLQGHLFARAGKPFPAITW